MGVSNACSDARHSLSAGGTQFMSAATGTGKTAAFLIPLTIHISNAADTENNVMGLVVAPIRELAIQLEMEAKLLMLGIPAMRTALLIGGQPLPPQLHRLQTGVQLIVGTPGRVLEVFTNHCDDFAHRIRWCVLDEVDALLDTGFHSQILQLARLFSNKSTQWSFVSATISTEVEELVREILGSNHSYVRLRTDVPSLKCTGESYVLASDVRHSIEWADDKCKKAALFDFINKHAHHTISHELALICLRTQYMSDAE
ncbi:hypothetical protein PINS_up002193 [Pythium insidiosum]|nr:hypothetical protein PINS_up002193 [Pythium insidiosum]